MDLCGPAEKYLPLAAEGTPEGLTPLAMRIFLNKKVDATLNQAIDSSIEGFKNRIRLSEQVTQNISVSSLPNDQRSLLVTLALVGKIQNVFINVVDFSDGGSSYKVNRTKLLQSFPDLGEARATQMADLLNALFATPSFQQSQRIASLSFDLFYKYALKNLDSLLGIVTDLRPFFGNYLSRAQGFQARLGSVVFDGFDLSLLAKAWKGSAALTVFEKKNVMRLIQRIHAIDGALDASVQAQALAFPLSLQEAVAFSGSAERLQKVKNILVSAESLQAEKREVLNSCHKSITQALMASPSQAQQVRYLALMEKVKQASREAAEKYLQGSALQLAQTVIDQAQFSKPVGLQEMKTSLQAEIAHMAIQSAATTEKIRQLALSDAVSLLTVSFIPNREGKSLLFRDIQEMCDTFTPAAFEDKALGEIETIQIGWQSSLFPELGAGIMAHEIGHMVSFAVQDQKQGVTAYQEARARSAVLHSFLLLKEASNASPNQYREEDWADTFSSTVLKVLRAKGFQPTNFACALVPVDDKNKTYRDLKISDLSGQDVHSEGLTRALLTQGRLGKKMPGSCSRMLGSQLTSLFANSGSK